MKFLYKLLTFFLLSYGISSAGPIMLGYFMPTSGKWGVNYFDPKLNHGYNAAVQSFIKIDCLTDLKCKLIDQYGMSPSDIQKNIASAKLNGLKYALASFTWQGSDNFNVGSSDPKHLDILASKIAEFVKKTGLDGIDFDLEDTLANKNWTGDTLHNLIVDIRKYNTNLIVTAAPQLFIDPNNPSKYILVTSGITRDYDVAISAGDFNYLIIQAAFGFNAEANPDIVSNAFNNLTANDASLKIPSQTKLLIDVLSGPNVNPGNPNTVWHNCSLPDCSDVYVKLAQNYQNISNSPQFGGAATWSINEDKTNSWMWVNYIKPVTSY